MGKGRRCRQVLAALFALFVLAPVATWAQANPTISSITPTSGSSGGGTPVTITGVNFVNTSTYSATFGGTTVPATFASATTLTATTPAGNGPVQVTVNDTTTDQAANGSATFTYAAPTVTGLGPTSGPANQPRAVTIRGTNFTPAATVTVNGVSATGVTFVNANQLNATLPARPPGTYSVQVTTGSVTTAANPPADQYTYIASPTLTNLTPNSGTTNGGTSVTITGTNLLSATAVTFDGAGSPSFIVNNATQITAMTPGGSAGVANVSVTTGGGTATLVNGYTYVTLTAPAVTTQPADQTVAVGAAATFTAASSGSPAPTAQWQVSTNSGASFTNIVGATSTSYTTPATTASENGNLYRVVFSNSEGTATSSAATLTVVQAPTANAQSVSVARNTATAITLTGTDPNTPARTLTYSVATGPARGSLTGSAPNLTYTPTTDARGADSFTFTVSNGDATSAPATVSITIADPMLTITNSPTAGQRGTAYDFQFTTSGGAGPYSYAITSGALPTGLALSSTGRITGTPAASGSFPATVTVEDTGLGSPPVTQSQAFDLLIAAPTLTASPPPGALPGGTVGVAYSVNFSTSGGTAPYTYTLTGGSLPAGMMLNASTGRFSGTPTQAGGYAFNVTATDSTPLGSGGPYTLTTAYSETIQAPTIAVTPASIPQPQVGAPYSSNFAATGGTAPYTFAISAGAVPSGLSLSAAGELSGTPTQSGSYNFTITARDSSTGTSAPFTGTRQYTGTVAAPVITVSPASISAATTRQSYSQTLTASGGTAPYTFAVTGGALPAGIALTPSGVLAGSPTQVGSFTFTVTALDENSAAGAQTYTLSVTAPTIIVAPVTLANATAGTAYAASVTASGGAAPYTYAVTAGALPSGMTLGTGGAFSGTPAQAGTTSFTVTATDANGQNGSRAYTIVVNAPSVMLSPGTLPPIAGGVPYSAAITASGGAAPYAFSITAGTLPPGLALSPEGLLSGTTSTEGTFTVTVEAVDANGFAGSATYTLDVTVRPDPATDQDVIGLVEGQARTATRFAQNQITNFSNRLEQLRNEGDRRRSSLDIRLGLAQGELGNGFDQLIPFFSALSGVQDTAVASALSVESDGSGLAAANDLAGSTGMPKIALEPHLGPLAIWSGGYVELGWHEEQGLDLSRTMVGVSAGLDYKFSDTFTAGLGVGLGRDRTDVGTMGTESRASAVSGAIYGSFTPADGFFIDGLVGASALDFESLRYITATGGTATGMRTGSQIFAAVTAAYDIRDDGWLVSPYARVEASRSWLNGFSETGGGAFNLQYREQMIDALSGVIGIRTHYQIQTERGTITPGLRLEYNHDFAAAGTSAVGYANSVVSSALTTTATESDSVSLGLNLDFEVEQNLNFGLDYQLDLSGAGSQSHRVGATLNYQF